MSRAPADPPGLPTGGFRKRVRFPPFAPDVVAPTVLRLVVPAPDQPKFRKCPAVVAGQSARDLEVLASPVLEAAPGPVSDQYGTSTGPQPVSTYLLALINAPRALQTS